MCLMVVNYSFGIHSQSWLIWFSELSYTAESNGFSSRTQKVLDSWGESRLIQRWGVGEHSPVEPVAGFSRAAGGNPSRGKKDVEQTTLLNWPQVHSASQVVPGDCLQSCLQIGPQTELVVHEGI